MIFRRTCLTGESLLRRRAYPVRKSQTRFSVTFNPSKSVLTKAVPIMRLRAPLQPGGPSANAKPLPLRAGQETRAKVRTRAAPSVTRFLPRPSVCNFAQRSVG